MDFVNNVGFVLTFGWREFDPIPQFPDVFNAPIGGGIDFDHIAGNPLPNLKAILANSAGFTFLGGTAIEGLGQNPGATGFACSTGTCKKKSMSDPIRFNGVFQRGSNRILTD